MRTTTSLDSVETSGLHRYRIGAAVHVVATTLSGTRAAMRAAAALAKGVESRVHVIAARQVSADSSSDQQSASARAFAQEIMQWPETRSARVNVLPCLCRRLSDVAQLLTPRSVVVIGGRSRWWWASREQRLADTLTAEGYQVLFVPADEEPDIVQQ